MRTLLTVVSLALLVVAAIYLKWWAIPLLIAWVALGWTTGRRFQHAVEEGVSRSRGFVLREATVATDDIARDQVDEQNLSLKIELAITPRPGNAQVRPWEPGRLRLSLPDSLKALECELIEVAVKDGWSSRVDAPVTGRQRVRLSLSVPPATVQLHLRYFLEDLADIDLVPLEVAPAVRRKPGA